MLHKMIFTFALTFLLGFTQQTALLHATSHLTDLHPDSQQQDQAPTHSAACDQCLSVSHAAAGVGSSFTFMLEKAAHVTPASTVSSHLAYRYIQPYSARAPPRLV